MWVSGGGLCALSRIPFDFRRLPGARCRPFAPSVDRITAGPYTRANCRLICFALNQALSDWGLGVLQTLMDGMARNPRAAEPSVQLEGRLPGTFIRRKGAQIRYETVLSVRGRPIYLGVFKSEVAAHRHWLAARMAVRKGGDVATFLPKAQKTLPHQNPIRNGPEENTSVSH